MEFYQIFKSISSKIRVLFEKYIFCLINKRIESSSTQEFKQTILNLLNEREVYLISNHSNQTEHFLTKIRLIKDNLIKFNNLDFTLIIDCIFVFFDYSVFGNDPFKETFFNSILAEMKLLKNLFFHSNLYSDLHVFRFLENTFHFINMFKFKNQDFILNQIGESSLLNHKDFFIDDFNFCMSSALICVKDKFKFFRFDDEFLWEDTKNKHSFFEFEEETVRILSKKEELKKGMNGINKERKENQININLEYKEIQIEEDKNKPNEIPEPTTKFPKELFNIQTQKIEEKEKKINSILNSYAYIPIKPSNTNTNSNIKKEKPLKSKSEKRNINDLYKEVINQEDLDKDITLISIQDLNTIEEGGNNQNDTYFLIVNEDNQSKIEIEENNNTILNNTITSNL